MCLERNLNTENRVIGFWQCTLIVCAVLAAVFGGIAIFAWAVYLAGTVHPAMILCGFVYAPFLAALIWVTEIFD